jgi:hypothetical protein
VLEAGRLHALALRVATVAACHGSGRRERHDWLAGDSDSGSGRGSGSGSGSGSGPHLGATWQ